MEEKEFETLFEGLKCEFDFEEPNSGHQNRFLERLNGAEEYKKSPYRVRNLIAPLSAIAAILLLFFGLGLFNSPHSKLEDLADVSSEMAQTQNFFTLAINKELEKIEGERSAETQSLIDDAMMQLSVLEKDYKSLQKDLQVSGDDQRVIFAMISNFQNRVDLLENVLEHINQINEHKNNDNEIKHTI